MKKRIMKHFTLVELLVVITIIAILIGMLMPNLFKAQQASVRLSSSTSVASIAKSALAGMSSSTGSSFSGDWKIDLASISSNLLATQFATTASDNLCVVAIVHNSTYAVQSPALNIYTAAGNATNTKNWADAYQPFKAFKAKHAFDLFNGYYYFSGERWQTQATLGSAYTAVTSSFTVSKKRNDSETRVAGEYYDYANGDGLATIGYADGHVANMKLSSVATSGNISSAEPNVLNCYGKPSGIEAIE